MAAPADGVPSIKNDNLGVILMVDNMGVNWGN